MPPPTNLPLRSLFDAAHCGSPSSTLLILLPGAYDQPEDFIKHGFIKEVRDRTLDVDIQLVDAHTAYYTEFSVVERLHQDIIAPALRRGYQHIWLAGISLGGYGSVNYAAKHTEHITGMFLMAPFLGSRDIPASIHKSGGLKSWLAGELKADDYDRKLWVWLQGYARAEQRPKLYIGYGQTDRFASSNQLLADVLPPAQAFTTSGGHDWEPWQRLWQIFLNAHEFPTVTHNPSTGQDKACNP